MVLNIEKTLKNQLREYDENRGGAGLFDKIKPYLMDGTYLYHYTLTDNLKSIMHEGLIPKFILFKRLKGRIFNNVRLIISSKFTRIYNRVNG